MNARTRIVLFALLGAAAPVRLHAESCKWLQQALVDLPSSGGEIRVPAGVFTCAAPIVVARDNVVIRGAGPATILRLADGVNSPVLVLGEAAAVPVHLHRNLVVADLAIDGNRLQQDSECQGGPCGPDHPLRNNGISLRHVDDVRIQGVSVRGARSGGLVSELGCRRLVVQDFDSSDNHFDGLAAYETEQSVFSNLRLHANLGAGLSFDIGFNRNTVSEAVIADNHDVGIFMRDSRDNMFMGAQLLGNGNAGAFLAQVDDNPLLAATGNSFVGLVARGNAGAGLRVNDVSCADNLVVGAQFTQNGGGGVSEPVPGLVKVYGSITH